MGFFSKLIKTAAITGAAVGGVLYCKNRKETRDLEESVDLTGVKPIEFDQDDETITVQVNKNKIKDIADQAADKVIDASENTQEKLADKIGEENMQKIKEKYEQAKEKASDLAAKANEQKDKIIEKIGEDKIDEMKQKAKDTFDSAKDKVNEKVVEPIKEKFNEEDDFVDDIEIAVSDTPAKETSDDFLEDELDEM